MSVNLNHIAGLCLSILSISSSIISKLATGIFFLLLIKAMFIWLKTSRFRKKLKTAKIPSLIQKLSLKHNLQEKIKVIIDKRPFAFCLGLFHPKIFISTGMIKIMKKSEVEMILLHEKYHLIKNHTRTCLFLIS
jgi:Zn-dependent protease with chaperone function